MRVLLAEDDRTLSGELVQILEKNNYTAEAVYNGETALNYLENGNYDAAILDITMPKLDGITVIRRLRAQGNPIPILILSGKAEIEDKVLGLDSGANDYMTKPFDARELLARIRAMTRSQTMTDSKLVFGNLLLNRANFELSSPTGSFRLANKEFQMMELLMANPQCLISSERFLEKIWGYNANVEINVVWVYLSYLRKKLTELQADVFIRAARNAGYSLEKMV